MAARQVSRSLRARCSTRGVTARRPRASPRHVPGACGPLLCCGPSSPVCSTPPCTAVYTRAVARVCGAARRKTRKSIEEAEVRSRWRASVLAAAGAATLLAGCGIRVSAQPSPSARPEKVAVAPASLTSSSPCPSPSAWPTASPSPTPSPPPPGGPPAVAPPSPSSGAAEAGLAAAVRRVEAAARVKEALPVFDQLAASMVARSGVPGAAVAVVAGDTAAYIRCFGLRQMGSPDEVTEDTLFQLGAVSRSYTTTMLAALAGEGELRWDQPVRRVWPRLPPARRVGDARGDLPRSHGAAQRPARVRGRRAASVRLRTRRDPAAAAAICGRPPASAPPTRHRMRCSPPRPPRRSGRQALRGPSWCAPACSIPSATTRRRSATARTPLRPTGPRRTGRSLDRWWPRSRRTRRCSRPLSGSAPASALSCLSSGCS